MRRGGGVTAGLIILLVGLAFLLSNLGLLPVSPWELVGRYWPLLLILAGLAVLVGATLRWVIVVLLVVVIAVAALGLPFGWVWPTGRTAITILPEQDVTGVTAVDARVFLGAAQVRSRLPVEELYRLDLTYPSSAPPVRTATIEGDRMLLRVENRAHLASWGRYPQELVIGFDPEVKLDLGLELTAGDVDIDLTRYNLQGLAVKNTAGKVAVRLGAVEGAVPVEIAISAGDCVLYVPRDVGLRVTGGVGVGSNEFENAGLRRVGSGWEDDLFGGASQRVEANLRVSVGKITVRRF